MPSNQMSDLVANWGAPFASVWNTLKGMPTAEKLSLMALLLSIGALVFNHRQHWLGKQQLRLGLFEKRFEVAKELSEFFAMLTREGAITPAALALLANSTFKASFVFGKDLEAKLNFLWKQAVELQKNQRIAESPQLIESDPRKEAALDKWEVILLWFFGERAEVDAILSSYMRFDIRAHSVKAPRRPFRMIARRIRAWKKKDA